MTRAPGRHSDRPGPAHATGVGEARPVTKLRGPGGAWPLSALVASRNADSDRLRACWPWSRVRRAVCRLAAWLELVGGLGVADPGGHAVLLMTSPRWRDRGRLVVVVGAVSLVVAVLVGIAALVWWPLLLPVGVAWMVVTVPALQMSRRCRLADRQLNAVRPRDGWYLHSFAGDRGSPGAGRELLRAVCVTADREGQVLYLDTSSGRLVDYYRQAGFEMAAEAAMVVGARTWKATRMVRRPKPNVQRPRPS